jgi:hypothetical protein
MQNLELFLDTNKDITEAIYKDYQKFGYEYDDQGAFMLDINFMCKNIYNITIKPEIRTPEEYYFKKGTNWTNKQIIQILNDNGISKGINKYTKNKLIKELFYNQINILDYL